MHYRRGHPGLVLATAVATALLVACTSSTESRASHPSARGSALPRAAAHLGAAGCHPASPITTSALGIPQVEGTGHRAQLWGLLMFRRVGPAHAGDQEKIVWRMTGAGQLRLTAIAPDGRYHRLICGPEPHGGSNWNKPGDEWGAGYEFTAPGCWDLRAVRGRAVADVWLQVVS